MFRESIYRTKNIWRKRTFERYAFVEILINNSLRILKPYHLKISCSYPKYVFNTYFKDASIIHKFINIYIV